MLKSKYFKAVLLLATFIIATTTAMPAMAAESGTTNYLTGAGGSLVGEFPPIPGLFVVSQTSYTTSDDLYNGNGNKIEEDNFKLDVWVESFRFMASYPIKLWGANLYSQLILPLVNIDSSLSVDTPIGKFDVYGDDDSGLGNINISPLILNWHETGSPHYVTLGFDIILKQGASYDSKSYVNAGTGYTSYMPCVAYRYDNPQGLDIGLKVNYLVNSENDDTDYKTGDMIALESVLGWNFGKLKVGILANYTQQIEEDEQSDAKLSDSEYRFMNIGPSITYNYGPMFFNLNCQFGVLAENTSMRDSIWFNVTMPLYIPKI